MLEDLHPEIQLETTISNPMDYAQVIGFHGRDVKLGNDAVIIKEEFVQDGKVLIPMDEADGLASGEDSLVVLHDDIVLVMSGDDIEKNLGRTVRQGEGEKHNFRYVYFGSADFADFTRENTDIHS
jgi:hypothetical protein